MDPRHLPIARPCDEDWTAMQHDGDGRRCAACATTVVDLSSMTEREAKRSLERARASGCESLCVRYLVGADGEVEFRSPPPRRGVRELAVGLGLGLAALVGGPSATARADASIAPCGSGAGGEQHAGARATAQSLASLKPAAPTPKHEPSESHVRHATPPQPRGALMGKMPLPHDEVDDVLTPKL